jgi:epoxyqueuosine reductase
MRPIGTAERGGSGLGRWFTEVVTEFVESWYGDTTGRMAPLVGCAAGDDDLWGIIKRDIGPPCLTPAEVFNFAAPGGKASAEHLSVVSIVIPVPPDARAGNRGEKAYPAESWVRAKIGFDATFDALRVRLHTALSSAGIGHVIPGEHPFVQHVGRSAARGLASSWSERHAAYVCGLGTFGLCDGLITERGKAVVCMSLIVDAVMPATVRRYSDLHANCLFFRDGTCGRCIGRCPAGAISEQGHDKDLCRHQCFDIALPFIREQYGLDEYACGLCQTGVPCETSDPVRAQRSAQSA